MSKKSEIRMEIERIAPQMLFKLVYIDSTSKSKKKWRIKFVGSEKFTKEQKERILALSNVIRVDYFTNNLTYYPGATVYFNKRPSEIVLPQKTKEEIQLDRDAEQLSAFKIRSQEVLDLGIKFEKLITLWAKESQLIPNIIELSKKDEDLIDLQKKMAILSEKLGM